jgi:FtsH-binding integral membrane protein
MSSNNTNNIEGKKASGWWFLLPIFLTFVGGLIMYFALRNKDRQMAKNGLKLGVIMFVVGVVVSFFVPFPYSLMLIIGVAIGLALYYNNKRREIGK